MSSQGVKGYDRAISHQNPHEMEKVDCLFDPGSQSNLIFSMSLHLCIVGWEAWPRDRGPLIAISPRAGKRTYGIESDQPMKIQV